MGASFMFAAVLSLHGSEEHSSERGAQEDVHSLIEHVLESSSTESWSMTVEDVTEDEACQSGSAVCFRLRGLPFHSQPEDVRAFFHPTQLLEVYFCRRDGRPTGEAYVVLAPSGDVQACFARLDKKYIGNRYIELFEATVADLRAVKKMLEDRSLQGYVVRLRGLPYSATEADVRAFMDGVQLSGSADCIVLAHSLNGRPTGEAYVELADEQALTLAMTRHKEVMGARYIEVFNSSKMDKLQAQKQLEGLSSPQRDQRRWAMQAGGNSSVHSSPQPGQQRLPARQQCMPAQHYRGTAADPLADRLAQCHIRQQPMGRALGRMPGSMVVPSAAVSSGASLTPHLASGLHGSAGMVPIAGAHPPPGLQGAQASQAPLLQQPQPQVMMPQIQQPHVPRSLALAPGPGPGPSTALSPAALQLGQLQQLPALQHLMSVGGHTAAVGAGVGNSLLPDRYRYLQPPHQQLPDGQLLVPGQLPPSRLAPYPAAQGSHMPQACSQSDLQQLRFLPPSSVPGVRAVTMAAASQQPLPQMYLQSWPPAVPQPGPHMTSLMPEWSQPMAPY